MADPPSGSDIDPTTSGSPVWQEITVSGVLRFTPSFGDRWWYRVQPASELVESNILDSTELHRRPLRSYAISCFPLPQGDYYVVWSPQWIPSESLSEELQDEFWTKMSPRFWDLTRELGEELIWREEVEQLISFSHGISNHLCTRKSCISCESKHNHVPIVNTPLPYVYIGFNSMFRLKSRSWHHFVEHIQTHPSN